MIRTAAFRPEHLDAIVVRQEDKFKPKAVSGMAVTFLDGDTPIAILGGFPFGYSTYHVWGIVSDKIRETPISFHKETVKLLDLLRDKFKLRRIQLDVRCSFHDGQEWAEALGFKREGVMKKFAADGEDCWLFAQVVDDV